jgi:D-alanyl-D-alanine carboxypeptidase
VMQPGYRKVTVLQLLSHTGGFPFSPSMPMDQITARGKNGVERRYGYVKAAVVDPPQAAPGTKVIYSGGPVVVMAYIEKKTKKTYEQLMQDRLFWPLGMTTAGFADHMASEGKVDAPWGHRQENGKTTPIPPDHHSPVNGRQPVGGAYCSMIDLGKFLALHLQGARGRGELLKPETFQVLQTAAPGGNFAPGWSTEHPGWADPEGEKVLSHSGSIGTHLASFPGKTTPSAWGQTPAVTRGRRTTPWATSSGIWSRGSTMETPPRKSSARRANPFRLFRRPISGWIR